MAFKVTFLKGLDRIAGRMLVCLLPEPKAATRPAACHRVLFIRPGGVGDAILLVPAIRAFQQACPEAVIEVLAERRNAGSFALCPEVKRVWQYDRPGDLLNIFRQRYDVIFDTEQWHRLTAVFARLMHAPLMVGFASNERRRLFTHAVPYAHDTYEAESFMDLLVALGIEHDDVSSTYLEVPKPAQQKADGLLGRLASERFVAIFPGASIPERRWGTERFRSVAASLGARGIPLVLIGGGGDHQICEAIVRDVQALNLAGRTSLAESAAVIARSALLLSGDSGMLHVAVGLGRPTVSLFGPGIAAKWAPRGENHIVIDHRLSCSPCTRFGYTPRCVDGMMCLQRIDAAAVLTAVTTLWARSGEGKRTC